MSAAKDQSKFHRAIELMGEALESAFQAGRREYQEHDAVHAIADARAQGVRAGLEKTCRYLEDEGALRTIADCRRALLPPDPIPACEACPPGQSCDQPLTAGEAKDMADQWPDPIPGERDFCIHHGTYHCTSTHDSKPTPPGPFCERCGSLKRICGGCP